MQKNRIENLFLANRDVGKKGLIVFVNAGDPDLDATRQIIKVLDYNRVDVVELCVPFPNSFTDGEIILRSHQRALENDTSFYDVLGMVGELRKECNIPIVLLADYSYTVKPLGMNSFLNACKKSRIDGTLVHCLPPLLLEKYQSLSSSIGLETIFSLYPKSTTEKREKVYEETQGFIYLVTTYGKTGRTIVNDNDIISYIERVRSETSQPLAVGFGIQTADDLNVIYQSGADAVVIGSAVSSIIAQNSINHEQILHSVNSFLQNLYFRHWFNIEKSNKLYKPVSLSR